MSLTSCYYSSHLGQPYFVASASMIIRSMFHYCAMCPGSQIFMLHCFSWPCGQKRNTFVSIYMFICMGLPFHKVSMVTLITIKQHGWSTDLWWYASCKSACPLLWWLYDENTGWCMLRHLQKSGTSHVQILCLHLILICWAASALKNNPTWFY